MDPLKCMYILGNVFRHLQHDHNLTIMDTSQAGREWLYKFIVDSWDHLICPRYIADTYMFYHKAKEFPE